MNTGLLFDKIHQYYKAGAPLNKKDLEMVQRYELVYSLFTENRSRSVTISQYIAIQSKKGVNISMATAYRDLTRAEEIFVELGKYSKEFLRQTITESAIRDIRDIEMKLKKKDLSHSSYVDLMRLKDLAEKRIGKYNNLESEDLHLPDLDKFQPHTYNLELSPTSALMLEKMFDGNLMDMTNIDVEDVEIIEEEPDESEDGTD